MVGDEGQNKKGKSSRSRLSKSAGITLREAIDMGEYDPKYLATFSEWTTLSRNIQFEYIRKALDNRRRLLVTRWAEVNNVLDFRLKSHLKIVLRNIEKQLRKLESDREKLYLEYSV